MPSRSGNTIGDHSNDAGECGIGAGNQRSSRKGNKGVRGTLPPEKSAKLLEFTNDIREVVEKKGSGSLKTSCGRAPPRIVSVIKGEFLTPVVKGAIGSGESSFVTWSSLAAKSTNETVKETASASERDASASESSSYNTPMMFKAKQPREPLSRVTMKNKNIITSRIEPEKANYVVVSLDELRNLMTDAIDEMRHAADKLKRYTNKDSKIVIGVMKCGT